MHPAAPLAQQTLHFLCLWDGAHHAIEDDALRRLGLAQLLPHDPQDDVVADEMASLHHRLGLEAEWSAALHRVAEQVTGGELWQAPRLGQQSALGAFPGARRAHEENVQLVSFREGRRR